MATIVQNPNTDTASGWSAAIIILAIIVLGVLAFFVFDRGALTGGGSGTTQVNVPVSNGGTGGTGGGTSGGTTGGSSGGSGY